MNHPDPATRADKVRAAIFAALLLAILATAAVVALTEATL